ncbi:MAG: phytanoyl-CoA dioxygenase family protein [Halioglobus sp.]|nr:phytanoyl-CoA dioxygenase family protein [Halioglobus sp.]
MITEKHTASDGADIEPYRKVLDEVDRLIEAGDYEAGIAAMQKVARSSGNEELMRRLIELRVEAIPSLADKIHPEPMFEANSLLDNTVGLRQRLAQDGYLFLRNILPAERLLELRDQITQILAELKWIKLGSERMQARAICRPRREGQPKFFQAHDRIVKLEALHSLAHEHTLIDVMRQVLGDSVFPHPLSIVRLIFPDSPELATPPHQDFPNNQGTPNLTAAWIPLADCDIKEGSLAVLEGSNQFGVLPLKFHLGAGNRRAVLSESMRSLRWVGADFKLGDVLLFPSHTVHKAMENHNTETMRLSVDFRYQLEGEALTKGCLQPHFQRLSWEDIYSDWQSDELKYYWRKKHYVEVPWNEDLHRLPDDHVDEAYEQTLAYNIALTRRQQKRTGRDQD